MEKQIININYGDSEVAEAFSNRITHKFNKIVLEPKICVVNAKINIIALAQAACERKSKESPVATVIDDLEGNLILGCVVQYIPEESKKKDDEDEKTSGSWRCDFTFYEDQLPENCRVVKLSDGKMDTLFKNVASNYCYNYRDTSFVYSLAEIFVTTLREFLDASAQPDKIVEVEMPNYFTASVEVIDDKKVLSFIPAGATVKKAIKSDLDLIEE